MGGGGILKKKGEIKVKKMLKFHDEIIKKD